MCPMTICPDIERMINEVRDDRTHGASELARMSLDVLRFAVSNIRTTDVTQFKTELAGISQRLMASRPSMAPVYNAVKQVSGAISKISDNDLTAIRQTIIFYIDELIQTSVRAAAQIAQHIVDIVIDNDIILTHSYSSTVASALKAAYGKHNISVIITRSGPGRSGERTTWEMEYAQVPVTFIDDTAMGFYLPQANKIFVGADRICRDGGVVNGIGTALLAIAASYYKVPFYVLCENLKFDSRLKSGEVELEEKESAEVAGAGVLPDRVSIKNPYFDVTPLSLVTGIVTEDGLVTQDQILVYIKKLTLDNRG